MNFFQFASLSRQQTPSKHIFTGLSGNSNQNDTPIQKSPQTRKVVIQTPRTSSQSQNSDQTSNDYANKGSSRSDDIQNIENELKIFTLWANQQETFLSKLIEESNAIDKEIDERMKDLQ